MVATLLVALCKPPWEINFL